MNRIDEKRFKVIPHVGIKDNLTGKTYTNFREICKVLNEESDKADRNAELYYDLLYKDN